MGIKPTPAHSQKGLWF